MSGGFVSDLKVSGGLAMESDSARGTSNQQECLDSAGVGRRIVEYRKSGVIFAQGDAAESVGYIQAGSVKLSVLSTTGREAVIAMLGPGDFFGEGCLAGQSFRRERATAIADCTILFVEKDQMERLLHNELPLSDRFIAHILARNISIEEDLVDQLFNPIEKRLARKLLLLAKNGAPEQPQKVLPKVSQETLAEMVGATRSRINFFMNKFKRSGFIDYKDGLRINSSLLTVVARDQ
jgi:CRP/FNR family cyclic AMP-dependent transcriptional regulator